MPVGTAPHLRLRLHNSKKVVGAVGIGEKKLDFVDVDVGMLAEGSVLRDTVPNLIQNNQHTQCAELLAEISDIVDDKAVLSIDIGVMCEDTQVALDIQLKGEGKALSLLLRLCDKECHKSY